MGIARFVFGMAVRPVVEGAAVHIGGGVATAAVGPVMDFLAERFTDQSQRLNRALARANDRAWKALEVALAGEGCGPACLKELRAARKNGFLAPGVMSPPGLTEEARRFARFGDAAGMQKAEFDALARMGEEMAKAGYPNLGRLLQPRQGPPLL